MQKPVLIVLIWLILSWSATAQVIVHPLYPGGVISNFYKLSANGIDIPVETLEQYKPVVHFARLDYNSSSPLEFKLTASAQISGFSISPHRKNIQGVADGNILSFKITEPQYLVIKIKGAEDLFILVDSYEMNPPKLSDPNVKNVLSFPLIDPTGKTPSTTGINDALSAISQKESNQILYFPPGRYLTGQINIPSNITVYLADGSLIQATDQPLDYPDKAVISFKSVSNSHLIGRGIVNGNGRILAKQKSKINIIHIGNGNDRNVFSTNNITVDGITEIDPSFWGNHIEKSQNIHFTNFKVINPRPEKSINNTDGVDFDASANSSLYNAFLYTGDDSCVVKGLDQDGFFNCHDLSFEKVICYSNSAAAKIGTETRIPEISHISFKNFDVVSCDRVLAIDGFDKSHISYIKFEGFYVESITPQGEGREPSRFIEFIVTNSGWRKSSGTCVVDNVFCKDIFIDSQAAPFPSQIIGRNAKNTFSHVIFQNFHCQDMAGRDVLVSNSEQGNISLASPSGSGKYIGDILFRADGVPPF